MGEAGSDVKLSRCAPEKRRGGPSPDRPPNSAEPGWDQKEYFRPNLTCQSERFGASELDSVFTAGWKFE